LVSRCFELLGENMADHTPQRVVSLQPSASVILQAIGKMDRIAACTKYCTDICPELATRDAIVVADSWTAKADEILAAKPDLVIAAVPYQEKAVTEILKAGCRFLGLAPQSLADIYTDLATIAGIMGVPERGEAVIAEMQGAIQDVRARTNGIARPRVFCEEWGKPLIASQPWVAELVEAAGGEFVVPPGKQQSFEQVLAADPEVLVAAWCGAGDRVPLEKIIRERAWQTCSAARQGRVYCIQDEFLNTPAPTLTRGLRALAAAIHPALFPQPEGLRCITDVRHSQPGPFRR
jgi:iron complex transport system substrate-binding protein